jgi:hypothetical protein
VPEISEAFIKRIAEAAGNAAGAAAANSVLAQLSVVLGVDFLDRLSRDAYIEDRLFLRKQREQHEEVRSDFRKRIVGGVITFFLGAVGAGLLPWLHTLIH